jgi:hypothetical protein
MVACLAESLDPKVQGKAEFCIGARFTETQHRDPSVSTGNQDHGGVLRGDGDGKPDGRPADG